jgi:hypothetical protein
MLRSFLVLVAVAAAVAPGQTKDVKPGAPSRARIVCLSCGRPASDADAPFPPRKTILGQHVDVAEPQIARQAGVKPVVIQTPRTTIVAAVEGSAPDDLSPGELEYIQTVFPGYKSGGPLDAHQEAHLLAFRVRRIEKDLADLLELDADGRVKPEALGNRPVASSHVEVLVFSKPAGFDTFVAFQFGKDVLPLVGTMLDSGPTSAVLLPGLKEPGGRCSFAFSTALQLLAGLSRGGSGLQGWLRGGIARLVEDWHCPKAMRSPLIAPVISGPKEASDWDAFVADMIADGKVGDLGALAATPLNGLSLRSEAQARSLVKWMVDTDREKFAAMVRLLLHAPPADPPTKALLGALRPTWDHDLVSLLEAWKEAVKKSRTSVK